MTEMGPRQRSSPAPETGNNGDEQAPGTRRVVATTRGPGAGPGQYPQSAEACERLAYRRSAQAPRLRGFTGSSLGVLRVSTLALRRDSVRLHKLSGTPAGIRTMGNGQIGPKAGHEGLQVQNPRNRGLAGTAGALQSRARKFLP